MQLEFFSALDTGRARSNNEDAVRVDEAIGLAEHKPAAVDDGHPRLEPVADEEIADQGQRGDADPDRHEGITRP